MTDFVKLLDTAIERMPYGAAARGLVYTRARNALIKELRVANAPPREITRQRLLLEEAIRTVENAAVTEWNETGRPVSAGSEDAAPQRASWLRPQLHSLDL